ncbi:MAG: SMC-Scp complex subunit ScpB [Eubacterium sp.]|nr:SMC-Scp complex subunit ScpB [Eubacterium sp.]
MENNNKIKGIVEAILFAAGGSVPVSQLCEALELSPIEMEACLVDMDRDYARDDRGICLIRLEDECQLTTKTDAYEYIRRIVSQPKKRSLTDVLMETLSIIAYKQPVTKQEVEAIRGVRSDFAINKLIEYQLVQELGRLDTVGHPIVFGTTQEFLRAFGVDSIDDLPDIDEVTRQTFFDEAESELSEDEEMPV